MAEPHATSSDDPDHRSAEPRTSVDRRTMLKGIAIAGAAVPVLVACGSASESGSNAGTTTPPSPSDGDTGSSAGATTAGGAEFIVAAAKVDVGGGVILPDHDIVVTQPTKGTFKGFSATCTHNFCLVSSISGGRIHCRCHGSSYSIKDGSVLGGPAPLPLPEKPVKDVGGNIVSA